jgi:hypothetical protein
LGFDKRVAERKARRRERALEQKQKKWRKQQGLEREDEVRRFGAGFLKLSQQEQTLVLFLEDVKHVTRHQRAEAASDAVVYELDVASFLRFFVFGAPATLSVLEVSR